METWHKLGKEQKEYIREHYPTESARDIAAAIGCTAHTVYIHAARMGVRPTEERRRELLERWSRSGWEASRGKRRTAESVARQKDTYRRSRRRAERQMLEGRRPDKGFRFKTVPEKDYLRRYRLLRRGYRCEKGGWRVYWYGEGTRRTKGERVLAERHGYRFLPEGDDGRSKRQPDALVRAITSTLGTVI